MANDILSRIIETKKQEVAAARKMVPLNRLRQQTVACHTRRPFFKPLETPGKGGVNIIAEIKRASPSKGVIRKDLAPAEFALAYERGGAAAISVLTDTTYFQGSFDDLEQARQATSLPVLRKDFMISSYQFYESAALGADAVLLIARILFREQMRDYLQLCGELEMDALVEIHTEKDLDAAAWAGARLIGINNRNLRSFETDIATAVRMVSLLEPSQVAVAASGIQNRQDLIRLRQAGIHNFLIGESLVRSENPSAFLKMLMA